MKVYLETYPKYLLLNSSKYLMCNQSEVTKFILSPPLRMEEDNTYLIKSCLDGTVDFVKLLSYNQARILGLLDRGYINKGMAGDIVIRDALKFKVSMDMIEEGTDYSPHEGMKLTGNPAYTITISGIY